MMFVFLLFAEATASATESASTWWVDTQAHVQNLGLPSSLATRIEVRTACLARMGLGPGANAEQARTASRRLSRQFHPDRTTSNPPGVRAEMATRLLAITECHKWLNDPDTHAFDPAPAPLNPPPRPNQYDEVFADNLVQAVRKAEDAEQFASDAEQAGAGADFSLAVAQDARAKILAASRELENLENETLRNYMFM